jgi:hypothetical protein
MVLFLAVLLGGTGAAAGDGEAGGDLFVSPDGNDGRPGRAAQPTADGSDGPLATLEKAVERSRQLPEGKPRRIVLQQGEYYLGRPIDLGPRDSGLTIEAAPGRSAGPEARPTSSAGPEAHPTRAVVLYGGQRIAGWRRDGDALWAADLPEVKAKQWDFRMLAVNDRLCPRARLPKAGHFVHLSEFNVPWMSTTGGGWKRKPTQEELTTMRYKPEDLGPSLDANNAEVTVYHMWDESVAGIARNDAGKHLLTFSNPCGHPPGAFGVKKYVVRNVREGMTEPGQWYLDRTAGKVVYWPLPGEDMTTAKAIAPKVESILRIRGEEGRPVRGVTVRGLVLSATNTPLVAGGFGAGAFPGAVEVSHAADCRLVGLEIANVAGQGVRASNLASSVIEDCHVHDTGACGLRVQGGCVVRNNHVHHVGRIYPSGIALWADGRKGLACRIEHNTIHDTPYTAVACGGDDHTVEGNRIYGAMQELHDGAGIYITFCKRVTLRGNYIHDIVDTGGYGASAYYLDEQAEDCLVEGNLSVRVARPSHNHMARKNTLRANVFVCDADATLTFPRSSDFRVEKNVIVAGGAIRITRPEAIVEAADNIVFSRVGKVEGVKLDDYREGGAAPLATGRAWLTVDPKLVEYETGRVVYGPDSPVAGLGIPPLDVRNAGCRK